MSKIIAFVQVQGTPGIKEAALPAEATRDELDAALQGLGIDLDDTFIFLSEDDEPIEPKGKERVAGLKQGIRIHVSRCRKIAVTMHYLEKTAEEKFSPAARVRKVKAWGVRHFKLDGQDAAEHVLQICGATTRPAADTPLHELTDKTTCSACFDLVPEKRVEG